LREIVNLWPGKIPSEGQVGLRQGYKEEPLSAILCFRVCLAGVSTRLHPLDQEKIALSRFSVSCVSVFGTGGLSIPTIPGNSRLPKKWVQDLIQNFWVNYEQLGVHYTRQSSEIGTIWSTRF
jgi:hypothetical protein